MYIVGLLRNGLFLRWHYIIFNFLHERFCEKLFNLRVLSWPFRNIFDNNSSIQRTSLIGGFEGK